MSKATVGNAAQQMSIEVNGKPRKLAVGATIVDLLVAMDLGDQRCAVEVNRTLVRRDQHGKHVLKAGDQVEVVTLVGGG